MKNSYFQTFLTTAALIGAVGVVRAQPPHDEHPEHSAPRQEHRVEEHHVAELPKGRVEVRVGNDHYFEHRGTFYRPGPHGYVVVRPPRGAHIPHLPPHAARVFIGGGFYWRYDNVYYQEIGDDYVVVDPPGVTVAPAPDATVTAAPAPTGDYQSIYVGSTQYFFRDGQFFQNTSEGMVWTPAPIGAVTPTLPSDAQSVWYQEIEFFQSDGVYFRKTPDGYKVVNAPWVKN